MGYEIDCFLKDRLATVGGVNVFVHPLLPRIEKIFTKEKSTLAKQDKNVLLSLLFRYRDFPRLIDQKTVHFIYGTYQGQKQFFVSTELFHQLEEKYASFKK